MLNICLIVKNNISNEIDYITNNNLTFLEGLNHFLKSEVTYVASNKITLNDEDTEKVMSLIEALEDIDDVSDVYHNLDI